MADEITPERIKNIRKRYGLSQQAFASVLGIGAASIARYESGVTPSKANANLIRAAEIPEFMAGCLERDGDALSEKQRAEVERVIYAEITLNSEGEPMDVNEIYELTLQQEVLNEKAWDIMAQVSRARRNAMQQGDEGLAAMYDDIEIQIAKLVPQILSEASTDKVRLGEIRGQLSSFQNLMSSRMAKAS